jgi:hypothetical protein
MSFLFFAGCSSRPTRDDASTDASAVSSQPPATVPDGDRGEIHVDMDALERSLGLSGSNADLGYREKTFNTCNAGYGYSSSHDCRAQVMAVIRFRISCRESEGTESDVDYQQTPVASSSLKWSLGTLKGSVITDSEGYGSIRTLFSSSNRNARLKLSLGNNFLAMRAVDIHRVVAPKSFCGSR